LVNLQILRGFYESAIDTLDFLKKEFPTHPGVNFLLVKALAEANKLDDAQLHVNIISNSPLRQHPLYDSVVGHFYEKSGKNVLAIRFLNQSVGKNPLRDQDYYLMAKIYTKSRQYKESKAKLSEAMTLDPLNIKYKSLYAEILYELEGAETAIGYLKTELNQYKDNARLMGDIATFFYRNGQVAQFKEVKGKVEKLRSNDPAFYEFLIRAAQIEEKNDEVIKNARELIDINPGDVKTRMLLGRTLAYRGQFDEALEALDGVTKRLSTYPRVYYLKAKVYLRIKNYKKAMEAGEKEKENNPRIYNGYYILGETQRLIGQYTKATKNLEKAISIEPRNVESLMSLGWIKLNQSRYDIARELYLRAKKKEPSNPQIRKQLAFIYQGVGQGGLAVEEFKTYLKLYPNAPDRTQIQNQIQTLSR
jgi:tetratricopeptide (TPR) repeat protein